MPIEFRCIQCGRLLRTPDDTVGRQARCPECGSMTTVPTPVVAQSVTPPPGQAGSAGVGATTVGVGPYGPGVGQRRGGPAGENPFQSPIAYGEQPQPVAGNVPNYLVHAILCTLFCCLPFGIVAIVYAAQVNGKLTSGDFQGAVAASNSARTWCWVSFLLGLIPIVVWALIVMGTMVAHVH